jgi:hypothetical protein
MAELIRRRRRVVRLAMVACAAFVTMLVACPAAAGDRPTDKDVKELIEQVNHDRDRFEDQLDGKLKRSIVRGPGGEVNVERYLDDLQENVSKLKDRFTPQYAASAEATTVLRQGSAINRFMANQPPNFDGASEWNRLSTSLGQLAAAYGTVFPLSEGQQARRLNDGEVRKTAGDLAKSADRFKKELDSSLKKDKAIDKPTREAAVQEVEALKHDAEKLDSTIGDGKPASGEAQALLTRATAIRAAGSGRTLSPAAQSAWGAVEGGLAKVAQAFGMPARVP